MTGFEHFLVSQGFKVYHFDCKKMMPVDGYKNLSTMVNIDNRYSKGELTITFGLNRVGYPPELISPRINIHKEIVENDSVSALNKINNDKNN